MCESHIHCTDCLVPGFLMQGSQGGRSVGVVGGGVFCTVPLLSGSGSVQYSTGNLCWVRSSAPGWPYIKGRLVGSNAAKLLRVNSELVPGWAPCIYVVVYSWAP